MRDKCLAIVFLWLSVAVCTYSRQQSSSPAAPQAGASQASSPTPTSGAGFSIETEMFTYWAEEENSDVIACDIARYLGRGTAREGETKPTCAVHPHPGPATGIVIVSSDSTVISNFQIWRSDMATMNDLATRAAKVCTNIPAPKGPEAAGSRGFLDEAPEAASLLQSVIGMFATNESASSVAGTIKDQALMNAVAGKLKAWNISVIIPEIYNPYAMGGADSRNSIYFSNLENLMQERRSCLAFKTANPNTPPDQLNQIDAVVASIDAFQKLVIPPELAQNPAPKSPSTPTPSGAPARGLGNSTAGADLYQRHRSRLCC